MRRALFWITTSLFLFSIFLGLVIAPAAASYQNYPSVAAYAQQTQISFPTNTPFVNDATATPTITPTLDTTAAYVTPRVLYPLNPSESIMGGTTVPTAMIEQIPRDRRTGEPYEIFNFLLLGTDSDSVDQPDGVFRTDTMIIVSVNLTTETVAMLSLPRDLYVYIPEWTMQRLNLAWQHGEAVGWQGGAGGGFGLLQQTIKYNLGITIHYYAMVDFAGFKQIIDTLGGVTIAVDCPIEGTIFTDEYDDAGEPIFEDIVIEAGVHDMNSTKALFYARSRKNSNDFDRGRRQQQLLRAIWAEGKAGGWLADIPSLYDQLIQVVNTNIPLSLMVRLAPLALSIDPNKIQSTFFYTGYETVAWTAPDGSNVQVPSPNNAMLQTIVEFFVPPTQNRLVTDTARIAIYDNTGFGRRLDIVAADRLIWEGLYPTALGNGTPPSEAMALQAEGQTVIIDYSGSRKGSSVDTLADILQVSSGNILVLPDANREVDVAVYLGSRYNSCVEREVIAP